MLEDPLLTRPPVLASGVILPGDDGPVPCAARKNIPEPLALADALELALCHNARVQAAWADISLQAAAVGEARAAFLPTLSGTLSRINDQTRYPGSGVEGSSLNRDTAYGTLNWRILDFGGREANREVANQGLAAALSSHDAVLQKTLSEVVQAYFDAQTARAVRQAKEQYEEIARNTRDTAQRRETKGAGGRGDTLQAATALARATLDRNRAEGAWQKALSVLGHVLGAPAQVRIVLADELDERPVPSVRELDAWVEEARQRHPAILAARAQLEAARQRVKATRSDGLPSLDFSANYFENGRPNQGLNPTRTQERTLGVALSVPIFDGFSRSYKIRGAEAQVEQRRAELLETERQTLMEVVQAHADALAALGNLSAAQALLDAAREALAVSQRRFEKGAADILEILHVQSALADAHQENIRCRMEWRSARLRLLANAGLMGRGDAKP
ncbi:MAG: TolC family protein [Rhodocyclaceae bacterium]|nr:TolC family protein [Rhodocyclaceae bacterium]